MTTQLDCSIGFKKESAYGTAITPDKFIEFTGETIEAKLDFGQGEGMRPGSRVARLDRRRLNKVDAGGSINMEAPTKGLGSLLEAALGAATSTALVDTGVYQHVLTLTKGALGSYTIQKGIPLLDGSGVETYTFPGSQFESVEVSFGNSDFLKIALEMMARDIVRDVAYAAPSYPADLELFSFVDGEIFLGTDAITVPTATELATTSGAAVANIREGNVKVANGLDGEGWNLGGAGKRTRANVVSMAEVGGQITAELDSTVTVDAYLDQTTLGMVLNFTHPSTIGALSAPTLQIVIPALKLEGGVPSSNGGDVISVQSDFTALDNETDEPIYIVYRSTDATL